MPRQHAQINRGSEPGDAAAAAAEVVVVVVVVVVVDATWLRVASEPLEAVEIGGVGKGDESISASVKAVFISFLDCESLDEKATTYIREA